MNRLYCHTNTDFVTMKICSVILHIVIMLYAQSLLVPLRKLAHKTFISKVSRLQMTSSSIISTNEKRISSNGNSLDTQFVSENLQTVLSHLQARRSNSELIDQVSLISELRNQRNSLIQERDVSLNSRKTLSQQIGALIKEGKDSEVQLLKAKVDEMNESANKATSNLDIVDEKINSIFCIIPNLLDDRVPDGNSDSDNILIREWGTEKRKLGDGYMWHDEIGVKLRGVDVEAANRISGARFSVLKGSVARLERALSQYFLDFHSARGYEEVSVPFIVTRSTLQGTGQLPKFEEDLFKVSHSVAGEDAFLIPTAEVPVTNLYRDQLLNSTQLPMHYVSLSPSFRAEAGSYGRDTRGLLRQHQFLKVELVKICTPETSGQEHESMLSDVESLLQSLELPYRVVMLCSGDIGFSAKLCYDIEVWLPGQQQYREISSISNCGDFQSRRMSMRYKPAASADNKDKKSKKVATVYPHTLNGSGVAVGRALVAILENFQQPDGSVWIPTPLRSYLGNKEFINIP